MTLNQMTFIFLLHLGTPFTSGNSMNRKRVEPVACGCLKPLDPLPCLPFAHHVQTWEPLCVQVPLLGPHGCKNLGGGVNEMLSGFK